MTNKLFLPLLLLCGVFASATPNCLGMRAAMGAEVEKAVADHIPWSGYWWPIAKGELLGPLGKYDVVTGKRATWWELKHHPPGPTAKPWHGYCHGWAAASVLEEEPTQPRAVRPRRHGATQVLGVADLKGLLSACHSFDPGSQYGDRCQDGARYDPHDMAPDLVWRMLRSFIRDRRRPLIFDLDPGPEVWNYPVFAYRVQYAPLPDYPAWFAGNLKVWAADDSVAPDFIGTMPYVQTYTFQCEMRNGMAVEGSSRWTGPSVKNHPDFAWYPDAVRPENPELDYEIVQKLVKGEPVAPSGSQRNTTPFDVRRMFRTSEGHDRQGSELPKPISPVELVAAIANRTSDFDLDARLKQFGQVRFDIGERTRIVGTSQRAGYLYLLHIDPEGELRLMFPALGQDNAVGAQAEFRVPRDAQEDFVVPGPAGAHRIKILVTERPLILSGLNRRGSSGEAREQLGFRFFPAQQQQIRHWLKAYVRGEELDIEQLGVTDVRRVLPDFAQDEIVFYVQGQ